MRWARHAARISRGVYRVLVGKPHGSGPGVDIKIDLQEVGLRKGIRRD
jgi:hypothetical protein